jgi:phosphonate metabolism protein PhnM
MTSPLRGREATALDIQDLRKTFTLHVQGGTRLPVLRGVSLKVSPGECVVLADPSGAGKSTLLRAVSHSRDVAATELAAQGLLDILSSDYVPASALDAAFLLHRLHGLFLPEAIATVTATPAQRVALTDRGEIATGKRADLVRVRLADDLPVVVGVWREGRRVG